MSSCYLSTNSFKYKVDLNKINPGGLQRSPSAKEIFRDVVLRPRGRGQRDSNSSEIFSRHTSGIMLKILGDLLLELSHHKTLQNLDLWPWPWDSNLSEIFRRAPMVWTSQPYITSFLIYHIWTKCGISCVEMKKTEKTECLLWTLAPLTAWISKLTFQTALYILVIAMQASLISGDSSERTVGC